MARLLRRIDSTQVDEYVKDGWTVIPKAESYNGDSWAVLAWKDEPDPLPFDVTDTADE